MFLILLYLRLNFELTTFFQVYLLESCRTELEAEQKRHKEFADHELRQRQAYAQLQRQVATTHFYFLKLLTAAWLIEKSP